MGSQPLLNGLLKWVSLGPHNCTKITGSQVPIFPPQITPSFPSIRRNHDESPGRSGASWNLGQSDGFSSGLYEVEALSCFIASFEKVWWIHGNKNRILVEEIHGCHLVKPVKFPVNSSHWQFASVSSKNILELGKNTPPKTSKPLQVSCATEMDWKFGKPKGGFGTKGPRIFFVCWLVFCPGCLPRKMMFFGKESFSKIYGFFGWWKTDVFFSSSMFFFVFFGGGGCGEALCNRRSLLRLHVFFSK